AREGRARSDSIAGRTTATGEEWTQVNLQRGRGDRSRDDSRSRGPAGSDHLPPSAPFAGASGGGGSTATRRVSRISVRARERKVDFERTGRPRASEKSTSARNSGA